MNNKIAIVCPYHKENLDFESVKNLKITQMTNPSIAKYFLLPKGINSSFYEEYFPKWKIKYLPKSNFSSYRGYNRMMLSSNIYKKFLKFKYILIHQEDALMIKNISSLTNFDFDYAGATWPEGMHLFKFKLYVGNGGLSLRKTRVFYLLFKYLFFLKFIKSNEDKVISLLGRIRLIKLASISIANSIFSEKTSANMAIESSIYGYHQLNIFNNDLKEKIFKKFLNN